MKTTCRLLCLAFLFLSCKKIIQFHPEEVRVAYHHLNQENIEKIESAAAKSEYSFLVVSDLQRFYDETAEFVKHVNELKNFEFVLVTGDITYFGLNREFNLITEELKKLNAPFVVVIGNHDMLGNGRSIYKEMYGMENGSFQFGLDEFIYFNSNGREVGFDGTLPDLNWLEGALFDSHDDRMIFCISHVPPFSGDFDPALEKSYQQLLAATPNVALSMHGHDHSFMSREYYKDGIIYLVTSTVNDRSFSRVSVDDSKVTITQEFFE